MKTLGKLLPEDKGDKKTIFKILGVLIVGVMLLITSSVLKSTSKKMTSRSPESKLAVTPRASSNPEHSENISYEVEMENRLKSILKKMQGVGEVEVMITTTYGKEIILAEDVTSHTSATLEQDKEGGTRKVNNSDDQKKVVMQNANITSGNEPVVVKEKQPEIQGVLVISEGAGHSVVKQSITEAAQILLGIPAHRVTVHPLQKSNK